MARRPRLIRRTILYKGRIIRLIRDALDFQDRRLIREIIKHPGSVVVVPLLDGLRIVFVRQYRHAIGRDVLELPAGTLKRGERPKACAKRELKEETGWQARRLRRIGWFYTAPGVLSEKMIVFLADGLTHARARPEPDEFLKPLTLTLRAALKKIRAGTICDAKSIIGVLFAQRFLLDSIGRLNVKYPSIDPRDVFEGAYLDVKTSKTFGRRILLAKVFYRR